MENNQEKEKSLYEQRGVSSSKKDVHEAIKVFDEGIFPGAFCKILPDVLAGDPNYCNVMHADGPGTKSSLAYAYWKETGDLSVFEGIVQDSIVMNIDDLLCVGITDHPILYSSTINRNALLVPQKVIATLMKGTEGFIKKLNSFGMNISISGGETSDMGDVIRTLSVDSTVIARAKRSDIIIPNIQHGDVIVGFSNTGKAIYETKENSSIGSNGLTSARHDIFSKKIAKKYPETYDHLIENKAYLGIYKLTTPSFIAGSDWGKTVLCPTRTYAPVLLDLLGTINRVHIHAIIHCSGGGQTKIKRFIPDHITVVKDNLFSTPTLFNIIQSSSNVDWEEMYKVFNMGHRMEVYCSRTTADYVINSAENFGVKAQIIGYCKERETAPLIIKSKYGEFHYS